MQQGKRRERTAPLSKCEVVHRKGINLAVPMTASSTFRIKGPQERALLIWGRESGNPLSPLQWLLTGRRGGVLSFSPSLERKIPDFSPGPQKKVHRGQEPSLIGRAWLAAGSLSGRQSECALSTRDLPLLSPSPLVPQ